MPTPINHLAAAQHLLRHGEWSHAVRSLLEQEQGSFLLGHVAPDVQTISGQHRHETHFYTLPPSSDVPAYRALLDAHPGLAHAGRLSPSHAAFVAGYLAHLRVDEAWWHEIFWPFFGPAGAWAAREDRILFHNVLRTHLDRQDQRDLNDLQVETLAAVQPREWLPFVRDRHLGVWKERLVQQLRPGEHVRTAEVFAHRMHIPPEIIEQVLASPEQMQQIFDNVPPGRLETFRADALQNSAALIAAYLEGEL